MNSTLVHSTNVQHTRRLLNAAFSNLERQPVVSRLQHVALRQRGWLPPVLTFLPDTFCFRIPAYSFHLHSRARCPANIWFAARTSAWLAYLGRSPAPARLLFSALVIPSLTSRFSDFTWWFTCYVALYLV